MPQEPNTRLTGRDKAIIAAQGALLAIPYVGSALERFVFGGLAELRMKRVENTLAEIVTILGEKKASLLVTENFVNLLEDVAPSLARESNEDRRRRFRDLLTNAAECPADSSEWEEAELASLLLKELQPPGLSILAALAREPGEPYTLTSRPVSQVYRGSFDWDNPGEPQCILPYSWVVVEYWARLLRDRQLIHYQSVDARGGFGEVRLAERGRFLVKWTLRDEEGAL